MIFNNVEHVEHKFFAYFSLSIIFKKNLIMGERHGFHTYYICIFIILKDFIRKKDILLRRLRDYSWEFSEINFWQI